MRTTKEILRNLVNPVSKSSAKICGEKERLSIRLAKSLS